MILLLAIGTANGIAGGTNPILKTYPSGCKALVYRGYRAGKPIVLLAGGPGVNPAYMAPVARIPAFVDRRVLFHDQGAMGRFA